MYHLVRKVGLCFLNIVISFCRKDFQIPSWIRTGVDNDNTIRVPGEGGVSAKSPRAGDVYVTLKVGASLVNMDALCIVILKWGGNTTLFLRSYFAFSRFFQILYSSEKGRMSMWTFL